MRTISPPVFVVVAVVVITPPGPSPLLFFSSFFSFAFFNHLRDLVPRWSFFFMPKNRLTFVVTVSFVVFVVVVISAAAGVDFLFVFFNDFFC